MKKMIRAIAALAVAIIMPLAALAGNPPAIPVLIYGDVKIDGVLAPIGTKVTAQVGNTEVASFVLAEAGKYFMNISEDKVEEGSLIKFKINDKLVADADDKYKMVDVSAISSVKYDLELRSQNNSGGNSGGSGGNGSGNSNSATPATPAVPADPGTSPAIPATPATDQYGQVKGATDTNVNDGDIIQCQNSNNPHAVYIVKTVNNKKYIRHIVSLSIFNHYQHLRWENLKQVDSLESFNLSAWVRVNTGANGQAGPKDRVYEINADQSKHFIDMTAEEFFQHGGSEEAIYNINTGELNLYANGPAVRLR